MKNVNNKMQLNELSAITRKQLKHFETKATLYEPLDFCYKH